MLVWKNTSVIVKRVPSLRPTAVGSSAGSTLQKTVVYVPPPSANMPHQARAPPRSVLGVRPHILALLALAVLLRLDPAAALDAGLLRAAALLLKLLALGHVHAGGLGAQRRHLRVERRVVRPGPWEVPLEVPPREVVFRFDEGGHGGGSGGVWVGCCAGLSVLGRTGELSATLSWLSLLAAKVSVLAPAELFGDVLSLAGAGPLR